MAPRLLLTLRLTGTVVDLELPAAAPGLRVGLQPILQRTAADVRRDYEVKGRWAPANPVHGDGPELPEGQVPGRFGAVPPFGLDEAEQGLSGLVLGHGGNPGGRRTFSVGRL